MSLPPAIFELIDNAHRSEAPIVVLTGAGVSAESGIPTFRGPEGYWTVGSTNYRPEQLATYQAFSEIPEEVWAWYLYRRGVCRAARPNAAHRSIVELENALKDRFLLVTQNVDGLHLRAGNSMARTYQIHGNIDFMRCEKEYPAIRQIPDSVALDWPKARRLSAEESAILRCCEGEWARPHVLFFDECYDEALFRFESTIQAMRRASMLIVVGTAGTTNLPNQVVSFAAHRQIPLIAINRDPSPFMEVAERLESGVALLGEASQLLPRVVSAILDARA